MRILITAGPTREYIDTVRFISNASSGLTGYLTAAAAVARGHKVILISGPTACQKPKGAKVVPVISALDMYRQVMKYYSKVDAVIMTAAVGDYRLARISRHKLKKTGKAQTFDLCPNPDILAELGRGKKKQILIGFALEDLAGKANALKKFKNKNLNAILLNSPTALGSRKNQVRVYTLRTGWQAWPGMSKKRLGEKIIRLVETFSDLATSK
jgi:phosphopantothenoylcysteine decarboxylase / phosphopantothenate---cysteine ligase